MLPSVWFPELGSRGLPPMGVTLQTREEAAGGPARGWDGWTSSLPTAGRHTAISVHQECPHGQSLHGERSDRDRSWVFLYRHTTDIKYLYSLLLAEQSGAGVTPWWRPSLPDLWWPHAGPQQLWHTPTHKSTPTRWKPTAPPTQRGLLSLSGTQHFTGTQALARGPGKDAQSFLLWWNLSSKNRDNSDHEREYW